jgi:SAM-dependent methyltransferase
MNDQEQAKWEKGKKYALYFYRQKLALKNATFNRELSLPDYFGRMIGNKKEVTVAELGSGMFCTIGSEWKTAKVNIFPSDILSDEYNQILAENNITPLVPVMRQDMEHLTYPDNFFDIVHCCNALDHTFNPLTAIGEMYRVCKLGGFIYLKHYVNEGKKERYRGLHSWNFDISGDRDCIIWNPDQKYFLSMCIPGFINTIEKYPKLKAIVSILQKV